MQHTEQTINATPDKKTERQHHCLNCGAQLEGEFCHACGQRDIGERLNSRLLLRNLFEALTNLDSRLWRTLIELTKRPGHVAIDYVNGARASYLNPVQFIVGTFALYVGFLAAVGWLEIETLGEVEFNTEGDTDFSGEIKTYAEAFRSVLSKQMDLLTFITVPIFSFFTRWQYARAKRNFAETLTFVCFIFGQIHIYSLIIALLQFIAGVPYDGSQGWISFLVFMFGAKIFFQMKWIKTIIATAVSMLLWAWVRLAVSSGLAIINVYFF